MARKTILVYSGILVNPAHPLPQDFDPRTIAHSLALINRYTGHTSEPYSVAQHCCLVSDLCSKPNKLAGLLHDAGESFIGDVSSPLKRLLPDYLGIEQQVEAALLNRFGITEIPEEVHSIDKAICDNELCDLFDTLPEELELQLDPLPLARIQPWTWKKAEYQWMHRFRKLANE